MSCCPEDLIGFKPISIQWNVVRGDTASLSIQFLDNDEVTEYDTDGWDFVATVFNPKTEQFDELETSFSLGTLTVTATPDITESWGTGIISTVGELMFDLQATTTNDVVWTPVVGTIKVYGDVTGGSL